MPRPSNQSGPHSSGHPLHIYVNNQTESPFVRRLAQNSTLPHSLPHRRPSYRGIEPASVDTTRSVNGDRSTHLESAPTLESSAGQTLSSVSLPTTGDSIPDVSIGVRIEGRDRHPVVDPATQQLLDHQDEPDPFDVRPLSRPETATLECPFDRLGCTETFSLVMEQEWIAHSLTHFLRDDIGLDRAEPPKKNQCPFCFVPFVDDDGEISWKQRMTHVALHHKFRQSIARDATTDFLLYKYLLNEKVIDVEKFRDICGPRAYPSYGAPNQVSRATTPRATAESDGGVQAQEEAVSVPNERRRRRPRGQR